MKDVFPRIAFDMSSYMWNALKGGKDEEFGYEVEHEGKTVYVNSAQYGFDKVLPNMVKALELCKLTPIHMLMVFEGLSSKKRRVFIDSGYKAGRGHAPQEYEEFQKLKDTLLQTWKDLGAIALTQDYAEGDDTLGFLAENTESPLTVATFDGDLLALVKAKNKYGARVDVLYNNILNDNKYGNWDNDLITLYKSLVGDTSDKIKGCPGFGVKSWQHPEKCNGLMDKYGEDGCRELLGMLEAGDLSPLLALAEANNCPHLKLICKESVTTLKSYQLAKLHPEWVNDSSKPLQIDAGYVIKKPEKPHPLLEKWYGRNYLVTEDNAAQAFGFLAGQIDKSPFATLDIETSMTDEADQWVEQNGKEDGLDPLGSELTGLGMALGDNNQHRAYFSVDHARTKNVESAEVKGFVEKYGQSGRPLVIHNLNFELPVLRLEWPDFQSPEHGYLPSVLDTKLEASQVNENVSQALKYRSKLHLGYSQTEYDEIVTLTGAPGTLPPGGRQLKLVEAHEREVYANGHEVEGLDIPAIFETVYDYEQAKEKLLAGEDLPEEQSAAFARTLKAFPETETRRYKMRELSAKHVLGYGLDDVIMTAALHNLFRFVQEIEHTWEQYKQVQIDAAYLTAHSFLTGIPYDLVEHRRQVKVNSARREKAWAVVREYLISKGWVGTVCPEAYGELDPADIKQLYLIVAGKPFVTQVRKLDKLIALLRSIAETEVETQFAECLAVGVQTQDWTSMNALVRSKFRGEPEFNFGSPTQVGKLLYQTMGCTPKVFNKPTEVMKQRGERQGSAKTDVLAIDYAILDASEELKPVLQAIKVHRMVDTRFSLYFNKYPGLMHYKDGLLHPSVNQSQANTRRDTVARPNSQQMPKHEKIEGEPPEFRACIPPHRKNAVVVSFDFKSQELVLIADDSQDPNMLACFVGDNRVDMHCMTGLGIYNADHPTAQIDYATFDAARDDRNHPLHKECKKARTLGKKVNFTTEYGAMAPKLAETMLISVERAQIFIDAREKAFAVAARWKDEYAKEARRVGYIRTRMGSIRHLADAFNSGDGYIASKAERQAVNTRIQGSAAEQTKLAQGRVWRDGMLFEFDMRFYGPIHDELVFSVMIEDLEAVLPRIHKCMTVPFADVKLPCISSISFGVNFFEQIEIGEEATPEAIAAGLAEMHKKSAEKAAKRAEEAELV